MGVSTVAPSVLSRVLQATPYQGGIVHDQNPATILKRLCIDTFGEDRVNMESFELWEEHCEEKVSQDELDKCDFVFDIVRLCTDRGQKVMWVEDGIMTVKPNEEFVETEDTICK